ncbi:MAG TPA: two-component sensor histidine kinase [Streptomyces sp.]|nr:two-component sensor histidine kinase [Streptomyces sp.]
MAGWRTRGSGNGQRAGEGGARGDAERGPGAGPAARTWRIRRNGRGRSYGTHSAYGIYGAGSPDRPEGPDPSSSDGPTLRIQLNALQALARQVFGFRLAMIALGTPFALDRTAPGPATWLIGSAVLLTFMGSYVMWRDWERFGPLLLAHPALLGIDLFFGALLLLTATPESTLGYVTVCTPLLAGLAYGWRCAGVFAGLQILVLAAAYGANPGLDSGVAAMLVLPGFCVIAGAAGVTLRNLLLRFGAASRALTETQARLAVAEAVSDERARLAREMHDSVAKTLHGLALAADGLAHCAGRTDAETVQQRAEIVARAARQAAAESRELLSDLRRGAGLDAGTGAPLAEELAARTADWSRRTGIPADFRAVGAEDSGGPVPMRSPDVTDVTDAGWGSAGSAGPTDPTGPTASRGSAGPSNSTCSTGPTESHGTPLLPTVPHAVARQLLTIAAEALENAHRHAGASRVTVEAGVFEDMLRISVLDDGHGLPPGTSLEELRRGGHFGLVGMVERAAGVGARLRIGRGCTESGTEVRLELPVAALAGPGGCPPPVRQLGAAPEQPEREQFERSEPQPAGRTAQTGTAAGDDRTERGPHHAGTPSHP